MTLCAIAIVALASIGAAAELRVIEVEVARFVFYVHNENDQSKWSTESGITQAGPLRTFGTFLAVADVVSVNGRPARGAFYQRAMFVNSSPNPNAAQSVADTPRGNFSDIVFDLMSDDGRIAGSIMATGFLATTPPPGAPRAATQNTLTITGGTGGFLGARGQVSGGVNPLAGRGASVTENPALRRTLGGGGRRFFIQLMPESLPEIVVNGVQAEVFHLDFTAVSAASPARPGEMVTAVAMNLGPTAPSLEPGQVFPQEPLFAVNSPVEAIVDGKTVAVVNAIGFPGTQNRFRVDFRVPEDIRPGTVGIRLATAWISGPEVRIPVR